MSGLLRFDGNLCGLFGKTNSGDANDPTNYMLMCSCGVELGPLGRFLATKGDGCGRHTVCCGKCRNVTVIDKTGSILKHGTEAELVASLATPKIQA